MLFTICVVVLSGMVLLRTILFYHMCASILLHALVRSCVGQGVVRKGEGGVGFAKSRSRNVEDRKSLTSLFKSFNIKPSKNV
jgi:hypothetical protein